jgi:tRNA A37 methylthiotransferase MiaB
MRFEKRGGFQERLGISQNHIVKKFGAGSGICLSREQSRRTVRFSGCGFEVFPEVKVHRTPEKPFVLQRRTFDDEVSRMQSEQPLETTNTQEPEGQARPENLTVLQSAHVMCQTCRNYDRTFCVVPYCRLTGQATFPHDVCDQWHAQAQDEQGSESR